MTRKKQRKSDILWKAIMEEVFGDLLRFIFPDADQVYDMGRGFEYMDKELAEMYPEPEKKSDSRFADKLVKAYHRDGAEEWVLLHIEIQGDTSEQSAFAERMYEYFARIRQRYRKPVSALAIFTGRDGRKMPNRYCYEYRGTSLTYKYPAVSILDFPDEELQKSSNPFAHVLVAAKLSLLEKDLSDESLLEMKLLAARRLQEKGFDKLKVRAIFKFLRNYVLFENPEMNRKFDEQFKLNDKYRIMNMDEYIRMEAREEAVKEARKQMRSEVRRVVGRVVRKEVKVTREQTQAAVVTNLIEMTKFSDERIADIVGVTVSFVKNLRHEKQK